MVQTTYEIRVAGVVPEQDLEDMDAVTLAPDQVSTVLYGVADQAALYGLLERLKALGIEVVEVRRIPDMSAPPGRTGGGEVASEMDDSGAAEGDG
jgi:hypothetical protein